MFKGIYDKYSKQKKNEVLKNDIAAFFILIALLKSSYSYEYGKEKFDICKMISEEFTKEAKKTLELSKNQYLLNYYKYFTNKHSQKLI